MKSILIATLILAATAQAGELEISATTQRAGRLLYRHALSGPVYGVGLWGLASDQYAGPIRRQGAAYSPSWTQVSGSVSAVQAGAGLGLRRDRLRVDALAIYHDLNTNLTTTYYTTTGPPYSMPTAGPGNAWTLDLGASYQFPVSSQISLSIGAGYRWDLSQIEPYRLEGAFASAGLVIQLP